MPLLESVKANEDDSAGVPLFNNNVLLVLSVGLILFLLYANYWLCVPSFDLSSFLGTLVSASNRAFDGSYGVYTGNSSCPVWLNSFTQWTALAKSMFFIALFAVSSFSIRALAICNRFTSSRAVFVFACILSVLAIVPASIFLVHCGHLFGQATEQCLTELSLAFSRGAPGLNEVCNSGLLALIVGAFLGLVVILKHLLLPTLYLRLEKSGLKLGAASWSKFMGERAVSFSEILVARLKSGGKSGKLLELKLRDGTYQFDCTELEKHLSVSELMNVLRTHSACSIDAYGFDSSAQTAGQYTELWLKYFSNSNARKRTESLREGDILNEGQFRVDGELGQGGQGTVYLGSKLGADSGESETVVLKEYILPLHRGEEIFLQSLMKLNREAEILQKINHPKIVSCRESFVEDHRGYLVLEYVEGRSLKAVVEMEGPQSEAFVRDLALQMSEILEYLHGLNPAVIHRDLTPDNLILQSNGSLKLVDFNVAQQLESTATATVVGKHAYIPPEQFRGRPVAASDIYAAGGTLYFLLTGKEPEPMTVLHPRRVQDSVSELMDEIVSKCTALELSERFQSAEQLKAALMQENANAKRISIPQEELLEVQE